MKKVVFVAVALAACLSTFELSAKGRTKAKEVSGPTEIIEHKGTAFGVAQPDWVGVVLGTPNQKTLSKALGINKHIWVVSKSGPNLDFVKTWADQVDARAEIGASIKQGISDFVGGRAQGDKSDVEETVERYSARASAVSVAGLNKEADWWVLGRTKLQKKNDAEPKYTYIVVYSMDEDMYSKHIKEAFNGENDKVIDDLIKYLMNYTMVAAKD